MKAKDLKELLKDINDETIIKFYIWDYEYDDINPSEIGIGKFIDLDEGNYFNIGVNK